MVYLIAIIAGLAGFLFGYDEGVIAGSLHLLKAEFLLNEMTTGIMTGALPLGAFFGALIIGLLIASRLIVHLGRKKCLMISGTLFIIGAILAATAFNIVMLTIARFILGIAIGMAAVATPLYIAETAPPQLRGALVTVYQLSITLGILASYIINYFLAEEQAWRWMFASGVIPALILTLGMLILPESPRWLVITERFELAKTMLQKLRGRVDVTPELESIKSAISEETQQGKWSTLLTKPIFPLVLLGAGLFLLQQLSGINAVIYYAPEIFKAMAFDQITTQILATIGLGTMNVLMTIVGLWLIDRVGRRRLLLIGFIGMAASLLMIILGESIQAAHLDIIAFAGLLLYIASFAVSLGPVPYVIMSEIFPMDVRAPGMSVSSLSNWGFNFVVVFAFPIMLVNIGISGTLLTYAAVCIIGFILSYIFMPETKGISLEEIEHRIHTGAKLRDLGA